MAQYSPNYCQVILIEGQTIDHDTRTHVAAALILATDTVTMVVRHPRQLALERACPGEEWGFDVQEGVITAVYENTPAANADVRPGYGILKVNEDMTAGFDDKALIARFEAQVWK